MQFLLPSERKVNFCCFTDTCGFEDIRFRCDRPDWHKDTWPYKDVVIQDMMWLVEDAMPGDVLAFFCMQLPLQLVELRTRLEQYCSCRAWDTGP